MKRKNSWVKLAPASISALLGLYMATPVAAQQDSAEGADSEGRRIEEITVTAQRREQNLRDVPVSVAAHSAEQLQEAGVNSTEDLAIVSPSISFNRHLAPYQSAIRIRGIGTDVSAPTIEPSVSMVVDGVVMSRQGSFFTELADIERVEILRGPQSTLFGKNAVGGVLNIVTRDPSTDGVEGALSSSFDSQGTWRLMGTVSGPLSDSLSASLTANFADLGDNIIKNVNPDGPTLDGGDSFIVRAKMLWDQSDATSWTLIADYSESEGPNTTRVPIAFESQAVEDLFGIGPVDEDNTTVSIDGGPFERHDFAMEDYGASLTGEFQFGDLTITSITAYREWNSDNFLDIDQHDRLVTPSGYDDPVIIPGVGVVQSGRFPLIGSGAVWGSIETDQISQEFHLASPGDSSFRWLVGAFFWKTGLDFDNRQVARLCPFNTAAPGFTAPPPSPVIGDGDPEALTGQCTFPGTNGVAVSSRTLYDVSSRYAAVFGQADYDLTDRLTATLGLRFQKDEFEYSIEGGLGGPAFLPGTTPRPAAPFSGSNKVDDDIWTGRVALLYALTDDMNIYGSYSRGYKGPGLDAPANRTSFPADPLFSETVDSYEIGLRSALSDGRVTLNATGFWQEFEDLQQQSYDPNRQQLLAINAGKSEQRGVEIEARFLLSDYLTMNANLVYLDAEFKEFLGPCFEPRILNTDCQYTPAGVGFQDLSGKPLAYAPEWASTISMNYEKPVGNLLAAVGANVRYFDEVQALLQQDPNGVMDAYTIVNLTGGVGSADGRWKVTGFVNNLFDERYGVWQRNYNFSGMVNPSPTDTTVMVIPRNAERVYGLRLHLTF